MADLVGPVLEVAKFIGYPIIKYLRYHIKFNEHVDDFKQAQADLYGRKEDIEQQLREGLLQYGKKPKHEVGIWFRKAGEQIIHAQRLQDKVNKGKYLLRSCLGKLVDETTQAMRRVHAEGQFSGSLVVDDPLAIAAKLPTTELAGVTTMAEEIYEYLIGDEVRMIGVWGMGGIGKTTIMKHVHNKLLEEKKFNKLIWTTVSQDFDIRRLQKEIACSLNITLLDDENTMVRAGRLLEMSRNQGKYVVILDDVWSSFSLEDVGILEPTVGNGCKLVLTTRSEEVVRSMGCDKKVQVLHLSMDEALQLFLSKVGGDMLPNPMIESTMKLIVKECAGLPLAIVTVAASMRGISDLFRWENALRELRGHVRNFKRIKDEVFGCLQFSYDHLEELDKCCFLYCALYSEDHEIKTEEIIEYWMDEGLIEDMGTRKAMRYTGHAILQKLQENCLLERVLDGGKTKIHDVVRDMALHITKKRFLVKAGKQLEELEEWDEDVEVVSVMMNYISRIPPNMQSPKGPKLTTLLLSKNDLEEIPQSFFDHMPNLKILDLSYNDPLTIVPSLSKLQALKHLNLAKTKIKNIPQGLEMLVNLRYLNLGFTRYLEEIPKGIFANLYRLQHLALHPSSSKVEEIFELSKLEVFEGCFNDEHDLNMYVAQRKRLCKYMISVTNNLLDFEPYNLYEVFPPSEDYNKAVLFLGLGFEDAVLLPSDIQYLEFEGNNVVRSLSAIFGFKDTIDLKECRICGCDQLESLFSSRCAPLQSLEFLQLRYLRNLEAIVGDSMPPTPDTFSSLQEIYLSGCLKIKKLFLREWIVQGLHNLKYVTVDDCPRMEEIIASEEAGTSTNVTTKFTLPTLKSLTLYDLPELKSICNANGVMVCDYIQEITIWGCPKLKRIPLYLELDINGQPSRPPALEEIRIKPKEYWESVEWDHPNATNVLQPSLKFWDGSYWLPAV